MPDQEDYVRISVTTVTPRTAPRYGTVTTTERNSMYVLKAGDKLLVGPLGVNYFEDGPADRDVVYLRRWDAPAQRIQPSRLRNDHKDSGG